MASANLQAYEQLMKAAEFEHDITSDRSRNAMWDAFTEDYEIVEPPSLPHGGVYKGREEWARMNAKMRSLWAQKVTPLHIWDLPEQDLIILYTDMEWTAHETGRTVRFPAVELLHFRDAKICRVEMFLQDTKVILDTLGPGAGRP
ncbi:nuclear transport factor 2 family protein [Trujillonella endophytica]|uniref:SnoaL-like domain-containing protein n=1 Tax=Trujillonella endophytica TaxID=673521 RepID=A0A1H8WGU3_9ACTN|nr:nuclear transport factor 2 family protein [Trujillella endophytica]SEP26733.1 SnoaL-like domain-containing protein [Trujillella endophytica]